MALECQLLRTALVFAFLALACSNQTDDSLERQVDRRGAEQSEATVPGAVELSNSTSAVHPAGFDGLFRRGMAWFGRDEYQQASRCFDSVLVIDSSIAAAHYWLARSQGALASKASGYHAMPFAERAKFHFEQAVDLAPESAEYRFGLMVYYLRAPSIAGGSIAYAVQQKDTIAGLDSAMGWRAAMEIGVASNDTILIRGIFDTLASFSEDRLALCVEFAGVYDAYGNHDAGVSVIRDYALACPRDCMATFLLGRASASSQKYQTMSDSVLAHFILQCDHTSDSLRAEAYYYLGRNAQSAGKSDSARACYSAALRLSPSFVNAQSALREIDSIETSLLDH